MYQLLGFVWCGKEKKRHTFMPICCFVHLFVYLRTWYNKKIYLRCMKKGILICMAIAGAFALSSCGTRKSAINDLASLAEKVEEKGASFDMNDWEGVIREYVIIKRKMEKYEYSAEEQKEIGRLKGSLAGYATKSVLLNAKKSVDNINNQIEGGIDGFFKSLME